MSLDQGTGMAEVSENIFHDTLVDLTESTVK